MQETTKKLVLRAAEIGSFMAAFTMLVPPVPSVDSQVYRLAPGLIIGGALFSLSEYLAIRRGAQSFPAFAIRLAFFCLFGWLVYQRVWHF